MAQDYVDEWTKAEIKALSKWDKDLIAYAAKGRWLKSGAENEEDRPVLSARLIQSLATGQHNQNWTLHPEGISIQGFRFTESLDFQERTSLTSLFLWQCTFEHPCHFYRANLKRLSLIKCIFHDQLQLQRAKIEGDLDLVGSHFEDRSETGISLVADGFTVHGGVFLRHGFKAKGTIGLHGAHISGDLDMETAKIERGEKETDCLNAQRAYIGGNVFLRDRFTCTGQLDFASATIKGNLDLRNAELSGDLNFSNLTIDQSFRVTNVTCQEDSTIDLRHAHADVLLDDLASWQEFKEIELDGFEYNHLDRDTDGEGHLSWLRKMPKGYCPQPYEQLAKNLKADGHIRNARMVLIEKQKLLFHKGKLRRHQKVWHFLVGELIHFGYRPWMVFPYIVAIIALGWLNFNHNHVQGDIVPAKERVQILLTEKENVGKTIDKILPDYPKFSPFIYSIDTFLPFVDLKQETYWIPKDKTYLWIHIALGWFLSSLLVAGLAGLVKKDD